jgi:predicted SAM-dependent methyltransferase
MRKVCTDFNVNTITNFDLPLEKSNITNLYWYSNPDIYKGIINFCLKNNFKKILEIGPGKQPFPLATTIVGFNEIIPNVINVNIEHTPLPFEDQSFDFLYCRHVLEDINYPTFALKEMFRVSKCVYIETPSPMVEMSRYIDAERNNDLQNNLRGYFHHRSFVWTFDNKIYILPKHQGVVEYLELHPDLLKKLCYLLDNYPVYWNNYYLIESKDSEIFDISFKMETYLDEILSGMEKSINNTNNFKTFITN